MKLAFETFMGSSDNMEMNAEACAILNAIQKMDRALKVQYLASYFGGSVEVDVELNVPGVTQWPYALVRKGDMSLWFIGGSPTQEITNDIIQDFVTVDVFNTTFRVPHRAANYGVQILGTPSYRKFEGQNRHRYFCWSYGTIIACHLWQRAPYLPPAPVQSIISYGAPRGVADDYERRKRGYHQRWWMHEDFVTAMPPHTDEAPGTLWALWGWPRGTRANRFCHSEFGHRLNANGTVENWKETNPYWSGRTFALTPAEAWWYSNELAHGHNLSLYENAFRAGVVAPPPPPPPPPVPYVPDPTPHVRPRDREEIATRAVAEIRAELNQPKSQLRDYLFTGITPGGKNPFRARVTDGTWFVTKGDEVVDVGPGKRVAKRLARAYNKAARGK